MSNTNLLTQDEIVEFADSVFNSAILGILGQIAGGEVSRLDTKSGGGNKHIYIRFNEPLPFPERIALQSCLGSDPTKEALSIRRFIMENEAVCALFEMPKEAERVNKWRHTR